MAEIGLRMRIQNRLVHEDPAVLVHGTGPCSSRLGKSEISSIYLIELKEI
jgi:hypothetical protein